MRYIVQLSLNSKVIPVDKVFVPAWVDELLPVKKQRRIEGVCWDTFMYNSDDKSIIETNWDKPYYFNDEYFIFLGGHVFNRIEEADKKGKYVPTPEEVFHIIINTGDNHYNFLKGNYHIILYDRVNKAVTIYSSPLSMYPAWFIVQDGILTVSNIMESLLREIKHLTINPQGLVEFSLFDHCLGANTIYENVFQLNGGHVLSITETKKTERLVYDIKKWITKNPDKRRNSLENINSTLKRHISEFTKSVKKFNISLTGGFDGRLNFSFIDRSDYTRLQAFSYGMKDSLQLLIPKMISRKLNFKYNEVFLNEEFEKMFEKLGFDTILYTGGVTPFLRANYPYGYGKITDFSRNCILGQCDVIRPLYTNPAGAIFNNFSHELFYSKKPDTFFNECQQLAKTGFLDEGLFTKEIIDKIYNFVREAYILPYPDLNNHERHYLFLMKESMLKFWQTECHVVDLFVNDFISFSDLDYLETISKSEYFGLYKGIYVSNQFQRRKGQDLYADLMYLNNNDLNNIIVDRLFKPKWIRRAPIGYIMIALGKYRANKRSKKLGNDTFGGLKWSETFYTSNKDGIDQNNQYFNSKNLAIGAPYEDNNEYRYDRHISLKIWMQYIGLG